ncbi:exonuclease SbcCD subunit D C-terminal domain-containing protein [Halomonas sp. DN3]|uniref:exonuclease SbcCD subunit D C-terminal domain-containing protein n=1 Tax=Halomonas sp. DN3 TaxID=2953657 RepID=UPI00209F5B81|nr:exonuclease SbcCD subunit D C-terminal domain-containing protein [Halomonas sp. DN3]USZ50973.1 exonuclease SbcCD subunit D C-terminal domain-containing protein [Halomonas sp. DN3]
MRIIHTADWHLGQSFHGQERHEEHRAFLDWLVDILAERQVDALLVAGDVFDVVNPSLRAQELLYDFIVRVHQRCPDLTIALIAGNHDSGSRIELPAPLMQHLRTHALGRVRFVDDGALDSDRLLVPLRDAQGEVRAWCLALPFLRPAEITGRGRQSRQAAEAAGEETNAGDDYVASVERVHRELIAAAREKREPGQALIAMSHAHLRGAAVSEASERPIVIGGEESLSASLFPEDIDYVALGHLHRAQRVGDERIRYSGSPLPLDFSEVDYPHQVLMADFADGALAHVEPISVPRAVAMRRLGPAPLEEILGAIEALPARDGAGPVERWDWLEINVRLDAPMPELRSRIEQALGDRAVRLLRLKRELPVTESQAPGRGERLEDIGPRELFSRTWKERWGEAPDDSVIADFDWLCQRVQDADAEDQSADAQVQHTTEGGTQP